MKTRSLAARLVEDGHVRVDGVRTTNSAKALRGGEVLTIALERDVRVLRVVADGERRGPYREACTLYEDVGAPAAANPGGMVERAASAPCHAGAKGLGSGT